MENLATSILLKKQKMNEDGKEQGYKFSRLWLNRDIKDKEN